tara:strand:- start:13724 stop:13906 length:183 start_codon:yes stop_codon:yes gene_type:complete
MKTEWREDLKKENIDRCPGCKALVYLPGHNCKDSTLNERMMLAQMIFDNNLKTGRKPING